MKKVLLVCAIGAFLLSCGGPDACDCIDNAMNVMDPSKFDKDLQKECEDYAEGLSDDDKKERAKEMLGCLKDK